MGEAAILMEAMMEFMRDQSDHFNYTDPPECIMQAIHKFRESFNECAGLDWKWQEGTSALRTIANQKFRHESASRIRQLESQLSNVLEQFKKYQQDVVQLKASMGRRRLVNRLDEMERHFD